MKKQLLILTSAVTAVLVTGCASTGPGHTSVHEPRSALAFTTVTDPSELVKWTGNRYFHSSLRSVDTYYFQVPDTGYNPGSAYQYDDPYSFSRADAMPYRDRTMYHDDRPASVTVDTDPAEITIREEGPASVTLDRPAVGATYRDDMGYRGHMGAPGSYQSGSGSYKVIQYRPGHVR